MPSHTQQPQRFSRRATLATAFALGIGRARAASPAIVKLGVLPFGSVQWVADVIIHHQLDRAHGFTLQTVRIANTEAVKVALLGGAVDVAVSDWPFVAAQRGRGGHLCFAAGNNSGLGGIMVAAKAPLRTLVDLKGRRLGVAGGPTDKSWLLVRAAALRQGADLTREATLSYGAPPLLDAMLRHGDLDAVLTFWNFAAKLEAAGFREAISVAQCAKALGLAGPPILLGYVFDDRWANANRNLIDGFLAAANAATGLLMDSRAEWDRIRPLMAVSDDAEYEALRARFVGGTRRPTPAEMEQEATRIEALLAGNGTTSDPVPVALPPGVFWQGTNAG